MIYPVQIMGNSYVGKGRNELVCDSTFDRQWLTIIMFITE